MSQLLPPVSRAGPTAAVLLAVIVALAAQAGRAAGRVAMMPLVAESLLPAASDEIEHAVVSQVVALGFDVQPMSDTRAQIEEGMRTGLDCTLREDNCAIRVGLVADVDIVLQSSVEVLERSLVLRAAWLDVQSGQGRRIVGAFNMPAIDNGASLRNLLSLLVTGNGAPVEVPVRVELEPPDAALAVDGRSSTAGTLWLKPGRHVLRAWAEGRDAIEEVVDVTTAGLDGPVILSLPTIPLERPFPVAVAAGVGLGITGGVVALGGGAAALAIDASLADVMSRDERSTQQSYGRAAMLVTGVAGALALGGLGLSLLLASDETPPGGEAVP